MTDGAMRFDRRVRRAFEEVLTFHDDIRPVHHGVHLAELEVDRLRDVAVPALLAGVVDVRRGSIGHRGLVRVEKRRQLFVLDVDQIQRPNRRVLIDGRQRGDAVPDVAHSIDAQRVLIRGPGNDAVRGRHVSTRDNAVHAVERQGVADVD